jgi:signal transduction histidine kinase
MSPARSATPDPDQLPDGLVVADADGLVSLVNVAAARLVGTDRDAALGQPLATVLPLRDAQGREWWACTDPWHGLPTRTRQPERELVLPDGRHLLVTATYVRAGGPRTPVTEVVVGLRGTEGRTRAERDRAELVATVAHELRSPLTSVKGFTATLLGKWDKFTDEQRRLMLETVEADADRVTRLITELLDVARIDSGRLELHRSLVDLPALLRSHVERLVAAGEPADRFLVQVRPPLPETWADADKLEQVAANLLDNAVRHGAGRVTVTVEPDGASGTAPAGPPTATVVTVDDEGPGVPDDAAPRVFGRFWRAGRRGGTGLGLYVAKGLVEAHGGTIAVEPRPSGGARFRFVVPAGEPPG